MASEPVIIKKYPNRRLYDTSASRYINLEDIATFVRQGRDLQVLDAQTGEDLTRVTLTQIIMEDAKQQPTGLPVELLRQLIVSSDRMGREFIMWYLKSAFDTYQTVQDAVQNRLGEMQSTIFSPVESMKRLLRPAAAWPASREKTAELDTLRKKIAELEQRLKPKSKKRRTKATGKRRKK